MTEKNEVKVSIYLASSDFYSLTTREWYKSVYVPTLKEAGFTLVHPWQYGDDSPRLKKALSMDPGPERDRLIAEYERDYRSANLKRIRRFANGVVIGLNDVDRSANAMLEAGYAIGLGKAVFAFCQHGGSPGPEDAEMVYQQWAQFEDIYTDMSSLLEELCRYRKIMKIKAEALAETTQ